MNFFVLAFGAALGGAAGVGGMYVHDLIKMKRHKIAMIKQADAITLETMKANVMREVHANELGDFPLLVGPDGTIRDPNTLRKFTLDVVRERYPELEQLNWIVRQTRAMAGIPALAAKSIAESGDGDAPSVNFVTGQTITDLINKYDFSPRLHSILIGEYVDGDRLSPLTLDIPKSVHILNTGASGLGKSTLLEAMAIQLSQIDSVKVAAIDYGSGTFDRLEPAMGWQIADDPTLAVALLSELIMLCNERKAMYKQIGRIRSLSQYNAATGDNLPFIPLFVDETSALLEHEGTKDRFIELARLGRKYGIGMILGGTDFKATTLPSEARSNCQARIAFWLEAGLSQSLLNCRDATELGDVGDIVLKKPGTPGLLRGHTPNVVDADYANLSIDGTPETIEPDTSGDGLEDRVCDTWHEMENPNVTKVTRALFDGQGGGANWKRVKKIALSTGLLNSE